MEVSVSGNLGDVPSTGELGPETKSEKEDTAGQILLSSRFLNTSEIHLVQKHLQLSRARNLTIGTINSDGIPGMWSQGRCQD